MQNDLFIGVYPGGLVYADRSREEHGDYQRVAFLPYDSLELEVSAARSRLLPAVREHAATVQAKRGELYSISACGQSVRLGGGK